MYQKKFAVALKSANGRVLREFDGDKVYVPFGGEYSVFLKNMHGRRAIAQVSIDGVDVGNGMTFVVPAHGQLEVERFIKNGNLHEGNRFKFIERTGQVAAHRGVDVEDGLIRVTFQLEKEQPRIRTDYYWHGHDIKKGPPIYDTSTDVYRGIAPRTFSDTTKSFTSGGGSRGIECSTASASTGSEMPRMKGLLGDVNIGASIGNEVGVTAPGSISGQEFTISDNFPLENEKTVFVLQILGETEDNQYIRKPVTVKTRPQCSQCGTWNKYDAKFCVECGSGLRIV